MTLRRGLKGLVLCAVLALLALPPRWFLDPQSMTLDRRSMEITSVRATPRGKWVPVYAAWRAEAFFLSPPFRECKPPNGGGWDHFQPVPELRNDVGEIIQVADTVRFYAHWMADCVNNHSTRLVVNYRVYLWGWLPLARKLTFVREFDPVPHEVEHLEREIRQLKEELQQNEAEPGRAAR